MSDERPSETKINIDQVRKATDAYRLRRILEMVDPVPANPTKRPALLRLVVERLCELVEDQRCELDKAKTEISDLVDQVERLKRRMAESDD